MLIESVQSEHKSLTTKYILILCHYLHTLC